MPKLAPFKTRWVMPSYVVFVWNSSNGSIGTLASIEQHQFWFYHLENKTKRCYSDKMWQWYVCDDDTKCNHIIRVKTVELSMLWEWLHFARSQTFPVTCCLLKTLVTLKIHLVQNADKMWRFKPRKEHQETAVDNHTLRQRCSLENKTKEYPFLLVFLEMN